MKKFGFTLAEVLITLAIIGVVASMTIPSVIVRTNQQEFRTGAKKAFSALSSAVLMVEAQDGYTVADGSDFINALTSRLNIIKIEEYDGNGAPAVFYTADGFRYEIGNMNGWSAYIYVDVNGDKGPSTSVSEYKEADYGGDMNNIENPEWPNVRLTDVFEIYFDNDGRSRLRPFTGFPLT